MNKPPPYESYKYRKTILVNDRPVQLVSNRASIEQCMAEMLLNADRIIRQMKATNQNTNLDNRVEKKNKDQNQSHSIDHGSANRWFLI